MSRVIHFEIPARDADRARSFYSDVFQWDIRRWDGPHAYWLAVTGSADLPGINGGIYQGDEANAFINVVDVESVDETLSKIEAAGGTIVEPKFAVPGIGYAAYCRDTEGNLFGLMEEDMTAE